MTSSKFSAAAAAPHHAIRAMHEAVETHLDPLGMTVPLLHAQLAWATHPQELAEAASDFSTRMMALQWHSWQRMLGLQSPDVESANPDDPRFADPVWKESASWDVAKEWYLMSTHHIQDMLFKSPGMSNRDRRRAAFWWREWLNAMAPTNFLMTNPVAMKKAMESNGESLIRGMRNFIDDLQAGNIRMTRPDDFKVGVNLATTPGKVVLQNRLLEVIHYTPTAAETYRTPILIVTPWINKFYILDLTPKKSIIKYLLEQGFDVYITSWKNPDASMAEVGFDDYLTEGIDAAVEAVRNISKSDKVHAAGYCIGGAALAAYMAWANRKYAAKDVPVESATFFTTLVDYHKPGDIEVFLDEGSFTFPVPQDGGKGFPRWQGDGCCLPSVALEYADLALRRAWLSLRRGAAAFRRVVLEHGHHAHAGQDAHLVSAQSLSRQQADQERCSRGGRPADRPEPHYAAGVLGVCRR